MDPIWVGTQLYVFLNKLLFFVTLAHRFGLVGRPTPALPWLGDVRGLWGPGGVDWEGEGKEGVREGERGS